MEGFHFITHTADIAVEIRASTIERLFSYSADAWKSTVLEKSASECPFELHLRLEANSAEELLVEFLSELNFYLFTRKLVFSKIKTLQIETGETPDLKCTAYFEDFNPVKHIIKTEIKAVTFHQMNIEHKENIFTTKIVFDI